MNGLGSIIHQSRIGEIVRFGLVGLINTLSTILVIYALMAIGFGVYASNFAGYAVGLTTSFTLNRRWTFRSSQKIGLGLVARFLLAVSGSYLGNLLTVHMALMRGASPHLAQIAGMPVYTILFYASSKLLVFKDSLSDDEGSHR